MTLTLKFLGTGTSTGVPVIGCDCRTCRSTDPRDQRFRSSVVLTVDGRNILIDTTPDLRLQALRANLRRIDAVLYTHPHADHTAGLDELRSFNVLQNENIPVWATAATGADLRSRFAYAFETTFPGYGFKPDLDMHEIDGPFTAAGVPVTPIPVMHGRLPILGFRVGDVAYVTDVKTFPDASRELLRDLDVLVITALRPAAHPAHLAISEALVEIAAIAPRRAYLTHMSHDFGLYAEVAPTLPDHVHIATDGLIVNVEE